MLPFFFSGVSSWVFIWLWWGGDNGTW